MNSDSGEILTRHSVTQKIIKEQHTSYSVIKPMWFTGNGWFAKLHGLE